ncbi:MAG: hypothetical protein Q9222_005308 [Ikaeria aurantiellina]
MLSILSIIASFAAVVCAIGTPPGYIPSTNVTLGLKYGNVTVKPGSILQPKVVKQQPILSLTAANTSQEYIAIFVDPTANLSSPIPASLVWFQQDVKFTPGSSIASIGTDAQVPYLSPSVPGHIYIGFLFKQPPNFIIPPDFPYNNTFRRGFNVSRVEADFKSGGPVAANFFELDPYGMFQCFSLK